MLIFPVREAASMKDFYGPIKNNFMVVRVLCLGHSLALRVFMSTFKRKIWV